MTSGAIDHTGTTFAAEPADPLSTEIARLGRRVAQLEAGAERMPRHAGPLTLEEFLRPIRRARAACDLRCASGHQQSKTIKVVRPTGMTLPAHSGLRRDPPRKPADRQPDYLEKFDNRTLFYDAFRLGDDVWLSGPPTNNLRAGLESADWHMDGADVSGSVSLGDWGRTQRSRITGAHPGRHLTLDLADSRFSMVIAPDESDLFAGQRTVITKSKDNDLVWIRDFLRYYHVVHGVTGVVFYDNNSTKYRPEDVADVISSVQGITTAVVVAWNYPWGPNAGPNKVWDSDYCQYSLMEHGRFRYLSKAAGVINTDIDELVLTNDARPVFDHAAESESGAVSYQGRWIAKATVEPMNPLRQRRFVDYRHRASGTTTKKWTVIPELLDWQTTQWRVHSVIGSNAEASEQIHHRHYQGVNNGWKYDRAESAAKPGTHTYDVRMSRVLDIVFGD
ncbi:capsule biosynthesis protein CapZ [Streptomyces endophyticus]|uniref:Capsule biosynthesis protein CapZ n=1 Tax=Streptomyces endophyticus TaxID=714166 RepID=A0ABU6EY47_9ACTN|nr:capsule biosynthesis protein CapZ [Streptomyces endophyticus]MEB8336529.1 capsule biosynthesis protein CapZ [Streptomyces endophyticus]